MTTPIQVALVEDDEEICANLVHRISGNASFRFLKSCPSAEVALKLSSPSSILRWAGRSQHLQAEPVTKPVVDTTAAGDSFAAAYISARLAGADPVEAARAGHRLAGIVVCYPGAIIPRSVMPASLGDDADRKSAPSLKAPP